jgi:hypothetical protein
MKNLSLILFSLLIFTACETVVDLELNEGDKSLVSEAVLEFPSDSEFGIVHVYLTESTNFFSNTPNKPVSSAEIILNDTYVLEEQADSIGYYIAEGIPKELGASYTLDITAEINGLTGSWIGADSLMDIPVVDSVYVIYKPAMGPMDDGGYYVKMAFEEPGNEANYYHQKMNVKRNDTLKAFRSPGYNEIYDDLWVNGQYLDFEINRRPLLLNDTVNLKLSSITEASYMFYDNVNQLLFETVGIGAAPPFALKGNLVSQNDDFENSLGNFKVKNVFEEEIIIQD